MKKKSSPVVIHHVGDWIARLSGKNRKGEDRYKVTRTEPSTEFTLTAICEGRWKVSGIVSEGRQKRERFDAPDLGEAVSRAAHILGHGVVISGKDLQIADVMAAWLQSVTAKGSTLYNYRAFSQYFCEWCDSQGLRLWSELIPDHLRQYADYHLRRTIEAKGAPPEIKTVRHYMGPVLRAAQWAFGNHSDLFKPLHLGFRFPRGVKRATSYEERRLRQLTYLPISLIVEILIWLEHSPDAKRLRCDALQPGIALQGLCALRLQEATRLLWSQVGRDNITVEGEVKNEHSLRRLPLPRLVSDILCRARIHQGHPSGDEHVIQVPSWKAYSSMFPHLFKLFKQSMGRNLPERFRPSDLRNTLPSEAAQRDWDDALVQAYMGQTWGKSIKDRHYVALVAADEIGEEMPDPMVDKFRRGVVDPLDALIEKALRHSTIQHDTRNADSASQLISER